MSDKYLCDDDKWRRQSKRLPNVSTAACAKTQSALTKKEVVESIKAIGDIYSNTPLVVKSGAEWAKIVDQELTNMAFYAACPTTTAAPPGTFDGAWFNVHVPKRPYRAGENLR